jgi:D-3-phosphoglycerate dehydrogenase
MGSPSVPWQSKKVGPVTKIAMPIVVSTHPLHPRAAELIETVATLTIARSIEPEALIELTRGADVIIVRAPLPAELFDDAPRLRAAIRHGAGVDMIPIDAATRAGVLVANVPGANARSVAEYVIFSALALARRFRAIDHDLRDLGWNRAREHAVDTHQLTGKTLGLIGLGNVGREVNRVARAFGMVVIGFKPSTVGVPADVMLKPLEAVITESDFLVLCCPLNEATRGMINHSRLSLMKPTAFLINVARGAVVVDSDLLQAIDAGTIAGASLDVFTQQPLSMDHPFLGRNNILLSPHLAGITEESMEAMGVGAAHGSIRVLQGRLPENLVNPAAIPVYRQRFIL